MADTLHASGRSLLSLHGEKRLEAAIVVHAVAPVERRVDHGRCVVPGIGEHLRKGGGLFGQVFPPHERHRKSAGCVVGACRHRWESADVVPVEAHRFCGQRVEGRCSNHLVSVSPKVIASKSVGHYPDNVHVNSCLVVSRRPKCPTSARSVNQTGPALAFGAMCMFGGSSFTRTAGRSQAAAPCLSCVS